MILQTAPTADEMDMMFGICFIICILAFVVSFYLMFIKPYEDEDRDEPDIIDDDEF